MESVSTISTKDFKYIILFKEFLHLIARNYNSNDGFFNQLCDKNTHVHAHASALMLMHTHPCSRSCSHLSSHPAYMYTVQTQHKVSPVCKMGFFWKRREKHDAVAVLAHVFRFLYNRCINAHIKIQTDAYILIRIYVRTHTYNYTLSQTHTHIYAHPNTILTRTKMM